MRWGSFYWDSWNDNDIRGEPYRIHWSEFEAGSYCSVLSSRMSQNDTLRMTDYYIINKVIGSRKDTGDALAVSVVGGDGQSNVVMLSSAISNTDVLLVIQGERQ